MSTGKVSGSRSSCIRRHGRRPGGGPAARAVTIRVGAPPRAGGSTSVTWRNRRQSRGDGRPALARLRLRLNRTWRPTSVGLRINPAQAGSHVRGRVGSSGPRSSSSWLHFTDTSARIALAARSTSGVNKSSRSTCAVAFSVFAGPRPPASSRVVVLSLLQAERNAETAHEMPGRSCQPWVPLMIRR